MLKRPMYRITIMTASLLLALVGAGCAPFADLLWPSPRTRDRGPQSTQTRISAEKGWQDGKLNVPPGSQVQITVVGGQWTHAKESAPYNNGIGDPGWVCANVMASPQCVEPLPSAAQGSLIGRIGSTVFAVGAGRTVTADESGPLSLRMNDGDVGLYDNDGFLVVRVSILR
jgi:hypothetical protein